jgi:hypothetical protein
MAEVEIEIAGRRVALDILPGEAGRARALARQLEPLAAHFNDEPDRAAFFARLALVLAAEIDDATVRIDALARTLRK